jgi:hypothetical protein
MTLATLRVDARQAAALGIGAALALVLPLALMAATPGGAQFAPIYTGLVTLATGIPGKIMVLVLFAVAMFQVTRGGFGLATGFILAALTLANIGTIIDAFFGATLPLAG